MMERRKTEGLDYCQQAEKAVPGNEKYAFSLAYYLAQTGESARALRVIEGFRARHGAGLDSLLLLADLYLKNHRGREALATYQAAAAMRDNQKAKNSS